MLNTEKLDNVINDFVSQFGLSAEIGTDFAYYYNEDKITYALVVSDRMGKMFKEFAFSIGLKYNVDVFLLSLLHEVAHHTTIKDLDDVEYGKGLHLKETLTDSDEDVLKYFQIYDEIEATNWAIDYINNNAETLSVWWNETLRPAIMEFYMENNIHD